MNLIESTPINIRPARPIDDIRCGQITASAWMASEVPQKQPHARAMFDNGEPLGQGERYRLIAELPNFVAGFADIHLNQQHVWYLFVEPDLQGLKIGGSLLDMAQKTVGGAITLQCLAAGKRTLNWYRLQGFRITGRHRQPLCGHDVSWVRLKREILPT